MANAWIIAPLPASAVVGGGTVAGYDPANVANDYAGVVWRATAAGNPYLRLDLGSDQVIDTVALFGLTGFTSGSGLTISVATSAQGSGFSPGNFTNFTYPVAPVLGGSVMPANGRGVGLYSTPAPVTGRHVLIVFYDLVATVEVARAVAGKRVQLERNFGFGAAHGVRDLGSLEFSRRGVLTRTRGKKLRTIGLTFSNVRKDEVEGSVKPMLEQIGNTEMVALITDPAADAQRQNRAYFGPLVGDLTAVWRNAAAFETKINLVSIF